MPAAEPNQSPNLAGGPPAERKPVGYVGKLIYLRGDALGTICAVPEKLVGSDLVVDFHQYLASGWASRNCGLNSNAIGSHLFPLTPSERVSPELAAMYKEKLRKIGRIAD